MRRARLLLTAVTLFLGVRCLPSTYCSWDAQALWADDVELHQRLAAGVDRGRTSPPTAARFMTGSARFDGEWLFGTSMMAALGHLQTARAHPELAEAQIRAADACIDRILEREVRRFDHEAWSADPLADLGSSRAHAAYLGYLNLVLSVRRVVSPDSPHAELNDRISNHLSEALAGSARGVVETYPAEVYPVDNAAVVASLVLHARVSSADHGAAVAKWNANFEALRDPQTGLLFQAVRLRDAKPVDRPRGSGTGLAAYFLSFADVEQSAALYASMRGSLHRSLLGFSTMREYPPGIDGRGDIDSGPLVFGSSISASGFAVAASRAHGDEDTFRSLWATVDLFGGPVDEGDARRYAFGGPLGDAMMFALVTARPAGEWTGAS